LATPQTVVLQIVDDARPKETSIDKIERVLAELAAKTRRPTRPRAESLLRRWL
jgi:hypothetical protein